MNVYCVRSVCALSYTNTSKYFVHHVPCAYVFILLHATYMFIFTHRDEMILMHAHIFLSLLGIKIMAFKLNGLSVRFCSNKLLFYWKERKKLQVFIILQSTSYTKVYHIQFGLDCDLVWFCFGFVHSFKYLECYHMARFYLPFFIFAFLSVSTLFILTSHPCDTQTTYIYMYNTLLLSHLITFNVYLRSHIHNIVHANISKYITLCYVT